MAHTSHAAPAETDSDSRNLEAFFAELEALGRNAHASLDEADGQHLLKMERWGRLCSLLGYGTAWIAPNPISAALICQGMIGRWLLMHHIGHKGYDRVPGLPAHYHSSRFAIGARRFVDWLEWMRPEAWNYEHNLLHHYNLNEAKDPDLVERNIEWLRQSDLPEPVRYAIVLVSALSWKYSFYAPSTWSKWQAARARRRRELWRDPHEAPILGQFKRAGLWTDSLLPMALTRFVLIPGLFLGLGPWASFSALSNALLADVMHNLYTFLLIVPNHCGEDLVRFTEPARGRREFFLRQIRSSVNYRTGGDGNDFLHMWLNYQIEHHLWPDLPLSKYQALQPQVKALCERYGVPYLQEGLFVRVGKMLDIMVGRTSMEVRDRLVSRGARGVPAL